MRTLLNWNEAQSARLASTQTQNHLSGMETMKLPETYFPHPQHQYWFPAGVVASDPYSRSQAALCRSSPQFDRYPGEDQTGKDYPHHPATCYQRPVPNEIFRPLPLMHGTSQDENVGSSKYEQLFGPSVFVKNLPENVSDESLWDLFSQIAPVKSLRVVRDSSSRKPLHSYINFFTFEDAKQAIDLLNFQRVFEGGKKLHVAWAIRDPATRKSPATNIFIGGLARTIKDEELFDTFEQFGEVVAAEVAVDRRGRRLGYGYVSFLNEAAAQKAIEVVDGKLLKGKRVRVGVFLTRQKREGENAAAVKQLQKLPVNTLLSSTSDENKGEQEWSPRCVKKGL